MTCSGDLTTFDAVISDTAEAFLASLSPVDREQFYRALDVLCSDPHPDGISKVPLTFFPYQTEAIGFAYGEFWMTYTILNAATIGIASVYWSPDSPRRAGELFEI